VTPGPPNPNRGCANNSAASSGSQNPGSHDQDGIKEDRDFEQFLADLDNDERLRAERRNLGKGSFEKSNSADHWANYKIPRISVTGGAEKIPRSVREQLSYTVKIKSLLRRKPKDEADIKECRKIWRNIVVLKIEDIGYSMGDVVYYYIKFRFTNATVKVFRKDLLFWRPRNYITKLKEAYERTTFRIQRVLAKTEDPTGDIRYLVKWFKYADTDNCWVSAKDLDDQGKYFRHLDLKIQSGLDLFKSIYTIKGCAGPNAPIFEKIE